MKRIVIVFLLILPGILWASGSNDELGPGLYAEFSTNRGKMIFRLDPDRTPLTVTNFCGLAEGSLPNDVKAPGEPFFDGLEFYREAAGYALFSGDPVGDGAGGPGYTFPRETGALISTGAPGILVMDGFSTESAGSRFFILLEGDAFLDSKYTAFGRIVSGSRTLERLHRGDRIDSVKIIRVGGEARRLRFTPKTYAEYLEKAKLAELENLRIINPDLADAVLALGDDRQKTPTGIYYEVLTTGEGGKPGPGAQVSMHYTGTLLDGTVFDSSKDRGQTFNFVLGKDGVIPGWIEMVMDMQPGEVRKVVIPPYLAYGDQGYGPIEPNSWLVFEMELVSFSEG
jgi:peptidylprolyl isomerase